MSIWPVADHKFQHFACWNIRAKHRIFFLRKIPNPKSSSRVRFNEMLVFCSEKCEEIHVARILFLKTNSSESTTIFFSLGCIELPNVRIIDVDQNERMKEWKKYRYLYTRKRSRVHFKWSRSNNKHKNNNEVIWTVNFVL